MPVRDFLGLCAAFPVLVLALPYVCLLLGAAWLARIIFRASVSVIKDRRAVHAHGLSLVNQLDKYNRPDYLRDMGEQIPHHYRSFKP